MTPLDFTKDGTPRDGALHDAAVQFYKKEFDAEPNFGAYGKVWAILQDSQQIIGMAGMSSVVDVSLFHVVPPTLDKAGLKIAEAARDIATWRLYAHLEDVGLRGSEILIFVSPKTERYWHKFLSKIKAQPANRWALTI